MGTEQKSTGIPNPPIPTPNPQSPITMALIVQKYGGSSVGTVERIQAVAQRVIKTVKAGNQLVVVVSAMGKTTDGLVKLASEISANPSRREMDMLLSTGEQISIALLSMALQELGQPAISLTGAQVGIVTEAEHTRARIRTKGEATMLCPWRRIGRLLAPNM